MGLLTSCSATRGGFLYTITVPGGGVLLPSSRVPGGMVMDEIDTCISRRHFLVDDRLVILGTLDKGSVTDLSFWAHSIREVSLFT